MKKTKKISKVARERVYMVRTALVLVAIALFFAIGGGILSIKNQMSTRTYTSDFMKMQFDYPDRFLLKDQTNRIVLGIKGNSSDDIEVFRMGTIYTNTLEHVSKLTELNGTHVSKMTVLGDSYGGVLVERAQVDGGGRSYFFVNEGLVYVFSTENPSLFSDLDAIAKSFRILE